MKTCLKPILLFVLLPAVCLLGCSDLTKGRSNKTKLIYFGFDDHSEKQNDVLKLSRVWDNVCPQWHATMSEKDADYRVLFGETTVSIVDRRGEIIYSGPMGPMYLPRGNPDGTGVNICKLTGE